MGQQILRYLYTGEVDEEALSADVSSLIALLQVAHRLELLPLTDLCAENLSDRLEVDTVAEVLQAADMLNCEALKTTCVEYVVEHAADVQKTNSFKSLVSDNPSLMLELFSEVV